MIFCFVVFFCAAVVAAALFLVLWHCQQKWFELLLVAVVAVYVVNANGNLWLCLDVFLLKKK